MMHFENYVKDANTLLHHVSDQLGIEDRQQAARVFRAVLHAIRDRILPEEALHLGAHMPIIWKGIYFDGYSLTHRPVPIRTKLDWINYIMKMAGRTASHDFPTPEHVVAAFQDVIYFLELMLPEGEFNHVFESLHSEIQELAVETV